MSKKFHTISRNERNKKIKEVKKNKVRNTEKKLLGEQIFEYRLFIGSPVDGDARVVPQRGRRISRDGGGGGIAPAVVRIDGNAIGWWMRSHYLLVRRTLLIITRRIRTRSH